MEECEIALVVGGRALELCIDLLEHLIALGFHPEVQPLGSAEGHLDEEVPRALPVLGFPDLELPLVAFTVGLAQKEDLRPSCRLVAVLVRAPQMERGASHEGRSTEQGKKAEGDATPRPSAACLSPGATSSRSEPRACLMGSLAPVPFRASIPSPSAAERPLRAPTRLEALPGRGLHRCRGRQDPG